MRFLRSFVLAAGLAALAGAANACPVCASEDGAQLRRVLREGAWRNLAALFAPVPALVAAVGAVRLATPWLANGRADGAARRDER
jgi:hypothetical protein